MEYKNGLLNLLLLLELMLLKIMGLEELRFIIKLVSLQQMKNRTLKMMFQMIYYQILLYPLFTIEINLW